MVRAHRHQDSSHDDVRWIHCHRPTPDLGNPVGVIELVHDEKPGLHCRRNVDVDPVGRRLDSERTAIRERRRPVIILDDAVGHHVTEQSCTSGRRQRAKSLIAAVNRRHRASEKGARHDGPRIRSDVHVARGALAIVPIGVPIVARHERVLDVEQGQQIPRQFVQGREGQRAKAQNTGRPGQHGKSRRNAGAIAIDQSYVPEMGDVRGTGGRESARIAHDDGTKVVALDAKRQASAGLLTRTLEIAGGGEEQVVAGEHRALRPRLRTIELRVGVRDRLKGDDESEKPRHGGSHCRRPRQAPGENQRTEDDSGVHHLDNLAGSQPALGRVCLARHCPPQWAGPRGDLRRVGGAELPPAGPESECIRRTGTDIVHDVGRDIGPGRPDVTELAPI